MNEQRAWWKEAVVYQIYPKSFADSDGDGVGDLQGVIDRLDYVASLGVDVIWLNPVYESPQHDNGYDISDYRAIHEAYGTMEDWERLLEEVHAQDMKLIMDLVVNHTSTDHEWFQRSRRDEDGYREYYIWHEGEEPPNNWSSGFGGSAWEYDDEVGTQYLHLFDETQADLNWDDEAVREDVYEMMNWWLEKGIDGFRMDVINMVSKPEGLPDGDPDKDWVGIEQFTNGPDAVEYLGEMAEATYDDYEAMTVGECVNVDPETASDYVSAEGPMDMLFHFEHMSVDHGDRWLSPSEWELTDLKAVMSEWQTDLDGWNSLYLTNHDQPRIVSRFGDDGEYRRESAKLLGTLLFTLSGTPYVYQGQELGMTNYPWSSLDELDDLQSIGKVEAAIESGEIDEFEDVQQAVRDKSRDNARTPMQWDDGEHAGFTDGEPWLPVNSNYEEINVAAAEADPNSVLHYYRDLVELRTDHEVLVYGDYNLLLPDHESVWAYRMELDDDAVLVALNVDDTETSVTLDDAARTEELLCSNYDPPSETDAALTLRPYEARVYRLEEA
ncbi:glycoside hydrolase family 13 protein [Haloarcula salinisoli]|uniref:Alpha-glucosidase n=1 Tax=Haloarcula salinisoli TaxID=2487746 RepID=A0A8J8C797_9EURY|nr:alpha-glucosidase [Halomicroarcula salinisoli]MBX0303116.1 alpha-glucosidase [Halomicroarcula salinisoli]